MTSFNIVRVAHSRFNYSASPCALWQWSSCCSLPWPSVAAVRLPVEKGKRPAALAPPVRKGRRVARRTEPSPAAPVPLAGPVHPAPAPGVAMATGASLERPKLRAAKAEPLASLAERAAPAAPAPAHRPLRTPRSWTSFNYSSGYHLGSFVVDAQGNFGAGPDASAYAFVATGTIGSTGQVHAVLRGTGVSSTNLTGTCTTTSFCSGTDSFGNGFAANR